MSDLQGLLSKELQDLLNAEVQLTRALPKMASAAQSPKLKEAFEKHLRQTEGHVERLRKAFALLGEKAQTGQCKAMEGLIAEAEETIEEGQNNNGLLAELALIAAAQKVEHYEISAYGTLRSLARQIGQYDLSELLTHTLGEEESADFLLTEITKPILQQATSALLERKTARKQTAGV